VSEPCVFCDIVAGARPASILYADDAVVAFMDLRQVKHGHSLIIPRRHIRDIFGLDDGTGAALFAAVSRIARATEAALKPEGMTIWQSNVPPWQEVLHLHFHVMPRHRGDGVMRIYPELPPPTPYEQLEQQAALIREALANDGMSA
jgi:histidine triad (HIT) family protein